MSNRRDYGSYEEKREMMIDILSQRPTKTNKKFFCDKYQMPDVTIRTIYQVGYMSETAWKSYRHYSTSPNNMFYVAREVSLELGLEHIVCA